MPLGVIVSVLCTASGGLIGALLGRYLPDRLKNGLQNTIACCALAIGIVLTVKTRNLSAVVLSVILGLVIGELLHINDGVAKGSVCIDKWLNRLFKKQSGEHSIEGIASVMFLFCFSGTGIYGVLTEAFTGEYSILLAKSVLDFFTSMIFATGMGFLVSVLAIPQAFIYGLLWLAAQVLYPLMTDVVYGDFSGVAGIIMLAVSFNLLKLKDMKVMNMLPAMVISIPISLLWIAVMS